MTSKVQQFRDPYFDNLKFILILLMVFGHFCFENRDQPSMLAICNVIYSFHMPLFIFISGYFSKTVLTHRKNDVTRLLYPYVVFQFLHLAFTKVSGLGEGNLQFTQPTYQNWYLICLFTWRLLVPYFNFFSRPAVLIFVFVLSFGAGFVNQFGDFLGLYRSIYLLPLFVLGYYASDIKVILTRLTPFRYVFIPLFFVLATFIFIYSFSSSEIANKILYAVAPKYGYMEDASNLLLRILATVAAFIMGFLFLFIVPDRKTFFSAYGENTMTVYLVHMFIVWPLLTFMPYSPWITESVSLCLAIVLAILLSTPIAAKLFKPFTDPYFYISRLFPPKQIDRL